LTDHENITRPYLLERWEPSKDLKTWTLYLRKGVQFQMGQKRREFDSADVSWNLKRWLAKETGSSIRGLMSYLQPEGIEEVHRHPPHRQAAPHHSPDGRPRAPLPLPGAGPAAGVGRRLPQGAVGDRAVRPGQVRGGRAGGRQAPQRLLAVGAAVHRGDPVPRP